MLQRSVPDGYLRSIIGKRHAPQSAVQRPDFSEKVFQAKLLAMSIRNGEKLVASGAPVDLSFGFSVTSLRGVIGVISK